MFFARAARSSCFVDLMWTKSALGRVDCEAVYFPHEEILKGEGKRNASIIFLYFRLDQCPSH